MPRRLFSGIIGLTPYTKIIKGKWDSRKGKSFSKKKTLL